MYKKKFFFLVFEGIEGTGKSFQIKKLYNSLIKAKYSVIKTREPGGSKTAEVIRKLIFSKNSNKFDKITDYFLMNAARNEHIKKSLTTAKKEKKIVISDRFIDSTYAYQVKGKGIDEGINKIIQNYIVKDLKPDLTIVLKSGLSTILKRINNRKNNNKFDKLENNFYKKAQSAFINLAKKNKKKYIVLDSSKNTNELEKIILKIVLKRIN
jgi:dTMP kinase